MFKKLATLITSAVIALGVFTATAPTASADPRCADRPGVQFWEDGNRSGSSITFCWGTDVVSHSEPRMSKWTNNLNFGATWHDRITSVETFNFKKGVDTHRQITLYADDNLSSASVGGRVVVIYDNDIVNCLCDLWPGALTNGFNDRVDSFRFQRFVN